MFKTLIKISLLLVTLFSLSSCDNENNESNEYVKFYVGETRITKKPIMNNNTVELPCEDLTRSYLDTNQQFMFWVNKIDEQKINENQIDDVRKAIAYYYTEVLESFESGTIYFSVPDGVPYLPSINVESGSFITDSISAINDPQRHGYVFAGWSIDGINEITDEIMDRIEIRLISLWNRIRIVGSAINLFNVSNYLVVERNMSNDDIITHTNCLIDDKTSRNAKHFDVTISNLPSGNIDININRINVTPRYLYVQVGTLISVEFPTVTIYKDMTSYEIKEMIKNDLLTRVDNVEIIVENEHTNELTITIELDSGIILGDAFASGRVPENLLDYVDIFLDQNDVQIINAIRRALDLVAIEGETPHLRGINFNITVINYGTHNVSIIISRIPVNVSFNGTAFDDYRLPNISLNNVFKDSSKEEVKDRLSLKLDNLGYSNLVCNNFDINIEGINTLSVNVEINRVSRTFNALGSANYLFETFIIDGLFTDMTNAELLLVIKKAINYSSFNFTADVLEIELLRIKYTDDIDVIFDHIRRYINVTGDVLNELNILLEDFNLNMIMSNDDVLNHIINVLEQFELNINHIYQILPVFNDVVSVDLTFRRANIFIDINSYGIYQPKVTGASLVTDDLFVLENVRYGLMLTEALNNINVTSLSHLNPSFVYTNKVIEQNRLDVMVSWGDLRVINIYLTLSIESQYLRDIFMTNSNEETLEFNVDFGTYSDYIISMILEDFDIDINLLVVLLLVQNTNQVYTGITDNTALKDDIIGLLIIDFTTKDLTMAFVSDDMSNYQRTMSVVIQNNIYNYLNEFTSILEDMFMNIRIDAWRLFSSEADMLNNINYTYLDINSLMPKYNVWAKAIYIPRDKVAVTINFEYYNVVVNNDVSLVSNDNIYVLYVYEDSFLLTQLRNLNISRRAFDLYDFVKCDGTSITTSFRVTEALEIFVAWQALPRYISIDFNVPSNAIHTAPLEPIAPLVIYYGQSIREVMGDLFVLEDLLTHYFVEWKFIELQTGNVFDSLYMGYYDVLAYAVWSTRSFTLYLFGNGGTIENNNTLSVRIPFASDILSELGYMIDLNTAFAKSGYNFLHLADERGNIIVPGMTMPATNLDLFVYWTEVIYQITFVLNGGSMVGYNGSNTVTVFMTFERFINDLFNHFIPSKNNYQFIGWLFNDQLVTQNTEFLVEGESIRLYAKWEIRMSHGLDITITSQHNIFNGSNTITFSDVTGVYNVLDLREFLLNLRNAYHAINNTSNSDFMGIHFSYVDGLNILDFHTGNNVGIINNQVFEGDFTSEIILQTTVLEYNVGLAFVLLADGNWALNRIGSAGLPNGSLVIPYFHRGAKVVEIAVDAFRGNTNIRSVALPRYVRNIQSGAFRQNQNLDTINLNNLPYLRYIGFEAFFQFASSAHASRLEIYNLPNLETIADRAFNNARVVSIAFINLPSLYTLGVDSFRANTNLNHLEFRELPILPRIPENTFTGMMNRYTIIFENVNYNMTIANNAIPSAVNQGNTANARIYLLGLWTTSPAWWQNRGGIFGNLNNGSVAIFDNNGRNITQTANPF